MSTRSIIALALLAGCNYDYSIMDRPDGGDTDLLPSQPADPVDDPSLSIPGASDTDADDVAIDEGDGSPVVDTGGEPAEGDAAAADEPTDPPAADSDASPVDEPVDPPAADTDPVDPPVDTGTVVEIGRAHV